MTRRDRPEEFDTALLRLAHDAARRRLRAAERDDAAPRRTALARDDVVARRRAAARVARLVRRGIGDPPRD